MKLRNERIEKPRTLLPCLGVTCIMMQFSSKRQASTRTGGVLWYPRSRLMNSILVASAGTRITVFGRRTNTPQSHKLELLVAAKMWDWGGGESYSLGGVLSLGRSYTRMSVLTARSMLDHAFVWALLLLHPLDARGTHYLSFQRCISWLRFVLRFLTPNQVYGVPTLLAAYSKGDSILCFG